VWNAIGLSLISTAHPKLNFRCIYVTLLMLLLLLISAERHAKAAQMTKV
jgi:hypothetical protein